jgi:hypothetical protein
MPATLLMLTGALWIALYPQSVIRAFRDLPRVPPETPWFVRPASSLPNDRPTRIGIRLFGMLLATVAAAHLYEQALRIVSR